MGEATSSDASAGRATHVLCQAFLFVLLLVSNVGQRITFKSLGYVLGSYPDFILLSVSGAFVVVFAIICSIIVGLTGGWLPETKTWGAMRAFAAIGFCNAVQGFGMVLANPYVPGSLQAQLQQATIPFTFISSWLLLGAKVTRRQCCGVLLIAGGICIQMYASGGPAEGSTAQGQGAELWALLFLFAQLPVALAAIFQESTFQDIPVNVFQMMFYASCAQFFFLLLFTPFYGSPSLGADASPVALLDSLGERMADAWETTQYWSAGGVLLACITCMLLAQLSQALMVKYSSASFTVLCLVIVVPCSSIAFALPPIMGSRVEHLSGATPYAITLVFIGILTYRFGQPTGQSSEKDDSLVEALLTPQISFENAAQSGGKTGPCMLASGTGCIASEYTAGRRSTVQIWEEATQIEAARFLHGDLKGPGAAKDVA